MEDAKAQPPAAKRQKKGGDAAAAYRRGPEVAVRKVRGCLATAVQPVAGVQHPAIAAAAAACRTMTPRPPAPARRQITDKKLQGKLRYSERLVAEAQEAAAKVDEWLLPGEAGELEAEGLERTWRFSQADIVEVR